MKIALRLREPMPTASSTKAIQPSESPATQRRNRFVLLLFLIALVLLAVVVAPYFGAFFTAALMAAIFYPLRVRMTERLGGRQHLAAGLLTAGTILVVVIPMGVMTVLVVGEAVEAAERISDSLEESGVEGFIEPLPGWLRQPARYVVGLIPANLLGDIGPQARGDIMSPEQEGGLEVSGRESAPEESDASDPEELVEDVSKISQLSGAASAASGAVARILDLMIRAGILIIALYFFLSDGCLLIDYIVDLVPMERDRTRNVLATSRNVAVGVLISMLATSGAQTAVALVGYLIAGVDLLALVVGATFVFAFIPAIGGSSVTMAAGILIWLSGRTTAGVFLTLWGLLVVSVVDNIIKPYVVKDHTQLPGSVIFFAMICGLTVFGTMGLVAGPLIVACFHVTAQMWREDRAASRIPLTVADGERAMLGG